MWACMVEIRVGDGIRKAAVVVYWGGEREGGGPMCDLERDC